MGWGGGSGPEAVERGGRERWGFLWRARVPKQLG